MGAEKRQAERKSVDYVNICDLTSLTNYNLIANQGYIVDASIDGFLLVISRQDLVPDDLRQNLDLESIVGQDVVLYLPQMNLDLDGCVTRATHKGKGNFEVAVRFSPDIPEYWKECLMDLLPSPGEID